MRTKKPVWSSHVFACLFALLPFVLATSAGAVTAGAPGALPPQLIAVEPKPVSLKPALAVVGASGAIQPNNCQNPKPALIATVHIKNSGGPLAAFKGNVYVSEDNGSPDRLVSGGVQLPAFAAGQSQSIQIPVISLSPYSVLGGMHTLTIHLLPLMENGEYSFPKPMTDYTFMVTFPSNFCKPGMNTPAGMPQHQMMHPGGAHGFMTKP